MPTPIKWDDVEVEQPTSPTPSQSLAIPGHDLGFIPTEDLVREINKRGYVLTPCVTSPSYTYTWSPIPAGTTTTTLATSGLGSYGYGSAGPTSTYSTLLGGQGSYADMLKAAYQSGIQNAREDTKFTNVTGTPFDPTK